MKVFETTFGYELHTFELKHLPPIWGIVKDIKNWIGDNSKWALEDVTSFAVWWFRHINDALVAVKDGKVVGCFYITDLRKNHWCNGHVFMAHRHRKPGNTFILTQYSIGYMIYKYGLVKMQAMVSAKQPGRFKYIQRMGFQPNGLIRAYKLRNGIWEDFIVASILREEYENLHKGSDGHGDSEGS